MNVAPINRADVISQSAPAPGILSEPVRRERERFDALVRFQQQVTQCVMAITGAEGATVDSCEGDEIILRAASGLTAHADSDRIPRRSPLVQKDMQAGRTQYCTNVQRSTRIEAELYRCLGVRSVLVIPLRDDTGVVGLLGLLSSKSRAFAPRDVETAELLA